MKELCLRRSALCSVLLTNGDIDYIGGLLTLREQQAFTLFGAREIHKMLEDNPVVAALNPAFVTHKRIELEHAVEIAPGLKRGRDRCLLHPWLCLD